MTAWCWFRFGGPRQIEWSGPDGVPQQGTLADLAVAAVGCRPLLVVPGEWVTLLDAKVPGRGSARLKAVPYALEDALAEDIEDLHFAIGPALAGEALPVAVCNREALQAWLESCAEAGVVPAAVVPDVLLLPYAEDAWSILVEDGRVVVRSGRWSGFADERDNLLLLLQLALHEAGENRPAQWRLWGAVPDGLVNLGVRVVAENVQPRFGDGFSYLPTQAIDLLQGRFSRQAQFGRWLRPWRVAAGLIGVWLGVQLALQGGEYWRLTEEQTALTAAMEQIYREAVPGARRVVNPRVQLENRLKELRAGGGAADSVFLDLLYRGGQSLAEFDDVVVRGLRYKDNQLDLDLESASLESFDRLRQRLSEQPGVQAEMLTTKRDNKVESRLTLKRVAL